MKATDQNWDDEIDFVEECRHEMGDETLVDAVPSLLRAFGHAIEEKDKDAMLKIGTLLCGIAAAADYYHGRQHLFAENEERKVVH